MANGVESGLRTIVGVNKFQVEEEAQRLAA